MMLAALCPHGVLDLVEHETISVDLSYSEGERLRCEAAKALAPAIANGLITLSVFTDGSGTSKLVISTNSTVGFCSSSPETASSIFVRVRPKVGTRRMLELAALAGMLPNWTPGDAYLDGTLEDVLVEWTLKAYAACLEQLLQAGGLRNTHGRVREELNSRLRGRLLIGPWLRNVVQGAPHRIPAEFPTLKIDNTPNRLLRWAIHVALLRSRSLPNGASLVDMFRRVERHFGGVSLIRTSAAAMDLSSLPPSHRHYTEALKLAQFVIKKMHFSGEKGDQRGNAIAINMNQVYERAFFNGLRKIEPKAVKQNSWKISLDLFAGYSSDASMSIMKKMIPDVYVSGDEALGEMPIIIDTKWKKAISQITDVQGAEELLEGTKSALVQIGPQDLYQATAYGIEAIHRAHEMGDPINGCVTALIYPTLGETPPHGRELIVGNVRVIIRIIGWNIENDVQVGIETAWKGLKAVAKNAADVPKTQH